jgi:hypothetical protein
VDEKRLFYLKKELNETIQAAALFGHGANQFSAEKFADLLDELIVMQIKQALDTVGPSNKEQP